MGNVSQSNIFLKNDAKPIYITSCNEVKKVKSVEHEASKTCLKKRATPLFDQRD